MSTLLTSKPKVKSRFDSRDDALEGYLAKRSERSADSNRPQNADDYNYDDIVSRHRRRNNTTGAAARDGLVLKKTTMRRQMKREGRLGKDGKVRRGRAAPTRVVSRGASDDFEVPWRESRRRRRSSRQEGAEEFKDEARAQRAPRRRGSSAPPQESIPTDGLSSAQLANLGRQLIADQRAQRRRSASVPPVVTEPVPAPAPAPAEPRKADSPPPPPPTTTTTSSRPRPRPAPRTARRRQPYTSAEAAKGDGAYSSVSDMASKKLSAAANYIGAVFGAPAPAPAPTRRKPAPRPPPAG